CAATPTSATSSASLLHCTTWPRASPRPPTAAPTRASPPSSTSTPPPAPPPAEPPACASSAAWWPVPSTAPSWARRAERRRPRGPRVEPTPCDEHAAPAPAPPPATDAGRDAARAPRSAPAGGLAGAGAELHRQAGDRAADAHLGGGGRAHAAGRSAGHRQE